MQGSLKADQQTKKNKIKNQIYI